LGTRPARSDGKLFARLIVKVQMPKRSSAQPVSGRRDGLPRALLPEVSRSPRVVLVADRAWSGRSVLMVRGRNPQWGVFTAEAPSTIGSCRTDAYGWIGCCRCMPRPAHAVIEGVGDRCGLDGDPVSIGKDTAVSSRAMARWLAMALVAIVLVMPQGTGAAPDQMPKDSSSACNGLAGYQAAMLKAGRRWVKGMQRDGLLGRSARDFDQAEWQAFGARAERLLADLKKIEPPAFAAPWHAAILRSARLKMHVAQLAPAVGFETTVQLIGLRAARVREALTAGAEAASAACGDFARFTGKWAGLDGQAGAAEAEMAVV
jgi:hypothetical protein